MNKKYRRDNSSSGIESQVARKYVPNLSGFIALCESNYQQFLKLLPILADREECVFGLSASVGQFGWIKMSITERSKYTVTLQISQVFAHPDNEESLSQWLMEPAMSVRLYHDAGMAEVLSFQKNRFIKPSYSYPNNKMYQKNEKAQCNEFLAEWLAYCLKCGHIETQVFNTESIID